MTFIDWDKRLATGIDDVDHEHQHLFKLVNALHDAVLRGKGKDVLQSTLGGVVAYTLTHFAREEAAMEGAAYPTLADHKALHEDLRRQVLDVQIQFRKGNHAVLSMQMLSFLKRWLVAHVSQADAQFGAFLAAKAAHANLPPVVSPLPGAGANAPAPTATAAAEPNPTEGSAPAAPPRAA